LLRWRRDVRHFSRRTVAEEDMRAMLACTSFAPSVGNAQPWRFVRLRSPGIRDTLAAHVDGQNARGAERYAGQARFDHYVSLKLHGLREAGHGLGIATMPEMLRYSCVLAIHTLWLAARLRGIGLGWVSILDPQTVHAMLDVPAEWSMVALLCIGYPAEDSDTPELERRRWQSRELWSDRVFER
jgi:5,6-dimethylbenzimidazole synthase